MNASHSLQFFQFLFNLKIEGQHFQAIAIIIDDCKHGGKCRILIPRIKVPIMKGTERNRIIYLSLRDLEIIK